MATKDYYDLLGLSRGASADDIKKAYRKLAHQHHPDKGGSPEDEAKFREVNEAYQVLSDPAKRQQYDQFGAAGTSGGTSSAGAGPGFEGFAGQGFDFGGFGDIFEQFFTGGAGTRTRGPARGADLEVHLTIFFDEAVTGTSKQVPVNRRVICATCHGNGAEPGTKIVECDRCGGSGEIRSSRQTILGTIQQVTPCPVCHGEGKKPEQPCHTCGGAGRVQETGNVTVEIPAGIDDGQTIRLTGQGEAGERGAPAGHLYVTVTVQPSKIFRRNGADIAITAPISYPQAALGAEIEVPTLQGRTTLKVPPGTTSGRQFRLKGEGIKKLSGSGRGDELVTVAIEVLAKLSAAERQALEELAKVSGEEVAGKKSWLDKLGL